jgi:hypothetical protein
VRLTPAGYRASDARGVGGRQQVGSAYIGTGNVFHAGLWRGTADSFVDLSPPDTLYGEALHTNGVLQVGYRETLGRHAVPRLAVG